MKIYERLKQLRKEHGYFQKDVAEYLSISKSAYGYYEQGRNEMDIDTIIRLSELYNVSIDFLLCKADIENKALTSHEIDMIKLYRELDHESKNIVYGAIYALHAKNRISE